MAEDNTDTIKIAGNDFVVPNRYKDGDEINALEAQALNQTFHENLRNNFAKKVTDKKQNKEDKDEVLPEDVVAELQAELDEYAQNYQFNARTGGGPGNPVMQEAMRIAKDKIREHIRKKAGVKISDYTTAQINAAAKQLIENNPEIKQLAEQRVEEAKATATANLDSLLANAKLSGEGEGAQA